MRAGDVLKAAPAVPERQRPIVSHLVKNVRDSSGHEHGNDGRFTGPGGNGSSKKPGRNGNKKPASGDKPDGFKAPAVARDHAGRDLKPAPGGSPYWVRPLSHMDVPAHVRDASTGPHMIVLLGGGGSGKGGVRTLYVGNHEKGVKPLDSRWSENRVIDADEEKKRVPIYSPEAGMLPGKGQASGSAAEGMYGPSGPKTYAELDQYSPEERQAINEHIANEFGHLGLKNVEDFRRHFKQADWENELGGGLTHEISSAAAKTRLDHLIAHPELGSFVYDSVGSKKHIDKIHEALKNGYRVTVHHVVTPREIALLRNQSRKRTVPEKNLLGTHAKLAEAVPHLLDYIRNMQAEGAPIEYHTTTPWHESELDYARSMGYTHEGHKPKDEASPGSTAFTRAAAEAQGY